MFPYEICRVVPLWPKSRVHTGSRPRSDVNQRRKASDSLILVVGSFGSKIRIVTVVGSGSRGETVTGPSHP